MVKNLKLPIPNRKKVKENEFDMHFNLLMIEPGVNQPQQAHTDVSPAFNLGNKTKYFHMVGLTAIDKQSFLYVQPIDMEPFLVLIEKGDTLLMRHDIPHAGAENLTERRNVRLHYFIDIPCWNLHLDHGYTIKKIEWKHTPRMMWDDNMCKYEVV